MRMDAGERRPDWPAHEALAVQTLGPCEHPSPLGLVDGHEPFTEADTRVLLCSDTTELRRFLDAGEPPPSFEPAGPRARVFFDPRQIACGILTCGGICPGINNVVRSLVLRLTYAYGVRRILGFRYGYAGLAAPDVHAPIALTPDLVEGINDYGGTFLGSSRGPQDPGRMVETLVQRDVGVLFVIGGDGGLRGASALAGEVARRGLRIGVIGVPKTIDNDLQWTWQSFGFDTAVGAAATAIEAAHDEARSAWNGVGLVKLMGRQSGFIAAHATMASGDVNFCLVPEVPFTLEGEGGFLDALERRLEAKRHAVVVVAEGAGQDLLHDGRAPEHDASGNVKLKDVGVFLRDRITAAFHARGKDVVVRYIDPSYAIRSRPADSFDAALCLALGQHAVHAGMAGRTNMLVGVWNQRFVHVPIPIAVATRRQLDPQGEAWRRVLEATGQAAALVGR
ncbi:MAG: ATP-dependent 6-phosphofructokinase [Candidatus Binatia bacterium]